MKRSILKKQFKTDMKSNELPFVNMLQKVFGELEALEKACKQRNTKARKLVLSPELAKIFYEEQTAINDQLKRLKLAKLELSLPKDVELTDTGELLRLESERKKSVERDLWLIVKMQQLIYQKITLYKISLRICLNLKAPQTCVLLEQTVKENENTIVWLDRIAQRLVNGESIVPENAWQNNV